MSYSLILPDTGDKRGWTPRVRQLAIILALLVVVAAAIAIASNPTSQLSFLFYIFFILTIGARLLKAIDSR